MITLLGGTIDTMASAEETVVYKYRLIGELPYREIRVKTDFLVPMGSNPKLNWNGCVHFKANGTISRFVDYPTFQTLSGDDLASLYDPNELRTYAGSVGGIRRDSVILIQVPNADGVLLNEYFVQLDLRSQYPRVFYFAWAVTRKRLVIISGIVSINASWNSRLRAYEYQPYKSSTTTRNDGNSRYNPDFPGPPAPPYRALKKGESLVALLSDYSSLVVESAKAVCKAYIEKGPVDQDLPGRLKYPLHYEPMKEISPRKVRDIIRKERTELIRSATSYVGSVLPRLEARAFDNVQKFDGNMLLLLSKLDIPGVTTGKAFLDLLRSEDFVKGISSWWLANRFGDRLLVGGLADLTRSIFDYILDVSPPRDRYIRGRARETVIIDGPLPLSVTYSVNLAVEPADYNGLMRLIRSAYEWDFFPSLANIWDAIPLSFVVNWFVNIGSIFEDVDRLVQSRYYNTVGIMPSLRFQSHSLLLPGVVYTYYDRWLEKTLNLGVSSVELGLPSTINVVDGISLIASF